MKHSPTPGLGDADGAEPGGDPWAAFGYLVAGVGVYGAAGWGLSVWLNASYWIPIGILVGAGFGLYLVFARTLLRGTQPDRERTGSVDTPSASSPRIDSSGPSRTVTASPNIPDEAARLSRPASDDRGETA